jgi:hypothetical protein
VLLLPRLPGRLAEGSAVHLPGTCLGPEEWDRRLREGTGAVATPLRRALPDRLADTLLAEAGVEPGCPLPPLRREERRGAACLDPK